MDQQAYLNFVKTQEKLNERAAAIVDATPYIDRSRGDVKSIEYLEDRVEIYVEEFHYGDTTVHSITVPPHFLYAENWKEMHSKHLEEARKRQEERERKENLAREEEKRKERFTLYQKLKVEFEPGK